MKKATLIMIIFWGVIGFAALGVMLVGVRTGDIFNISSDAGNRELLFDQSYPAASLKEISLSFASDETAIFLTDEDSVQIRHYGRNLSENHMFDVESSAGSLLAKSRWNGFNWFSFGFNMNRSWVEVYLPKSYQGNLDVTLLSGTVAIDGALNLSDLSVRVSSGNVRTASEIHAKNANIEVTSGTIRLTGGLVCDNYTIETSSGTIRVDEKLSGSGKVDVTSGSVKLAGVNIAESLAVKVSSGTVTIGIPDSPALDFSGDVTSGTIHAYFDLMHHGLNGKKVSAQTGTEPRKTLNVKVTSGTVRITEE